MDGWWQCDNTGKIWRCCYNLTFFPFVVFIPQAATLKPLTSSFIHHHGLLMISRSCSKPHLKKGDSLQTAQKANSAVFSVSTHSNTVERYLSQQVSNGNILTRLSPNRLRILGIFKFKSILLYSSVWINLRRNLVMTIIWWSLFGENFETPPNPD